MCHLAINFEFVEESKKEKCFSDFLDMALPERVVAGLSTSSSSMKARMTSLDSSLSSNFKSRILFCSRGNFIKSRRNFFHI